MVSPSAARHLVLVVGVLLCFFVYMGYVVKNRSAAIPGGSDPAVATADSRAVAPGDSAVVPPGLPLMTVGDGAERTSSEHLTPITLPGLPVPIGADLPDPAGNSSPPSGELNLAEGLLAMGGGDVSPLRPPPAGSIEESAPPPPGLVPGTAITGLVPDAAHSGDPVAAPLSDSAANPPPESGVSLPPPPGGQSIAEAFPPVEQSLSVAPARPESDAQPLRSVPPPSAASSPGAAAGVADQPPPRLRPAVQGDATPPPSPPTPPPPVRPAASRAFSDPGVGGRDDALRIYVVRPGDTLSRIADRELGSMSLADNIYLLNRDVIANPDHLLVGTRIKLPPRETVAAVPPHADAATFDTVPPAIGTNAASRVYRIAAGDTLSSISLRFYGSSAGWRFLHESNLQAIPDPNRLTVGAEIVIPPYAM